MNDLLVIIVLLACSGNNNVSTGASQLMVGTTSKNVERPGTDPAVSGNGIVGKWKMYLDAFDKNENQVLDDEERKTAIPNNYRLQLNADGTCKIQGVFKGIYKVKEEGGKKILEVQRKKVVDEETEDPLPDIYHIKSVTKDEMILLTTEAGSTVTFWIFKREQ